MNKNLVIVASVALAWGLAPLFAAADEIPEKYRETVRKGLDYIAKQQFKDGHWGANGDQYPLAMTGFAGMALLAGGQHAARGQIQGQPRQGGQLADGTEHAGRAAATA